ncbi:Glycerol kinase [Seminavis robusta]|uniref:glycerol kinase n=1 Tax=Seminavis robusta TaxID=568900 RepID=A0A9N8ETK8_9STRA|nr:Glycerol kinase [Seminavis robusta]|eukprot:Sro1926_g305910.1 Glycerol kinase (582) ;mRNA; f:13002-14835
MSKTDIIVAIDIGSSSVRCSAYKFVEGERGDNEDPTLCQAMAGCRTSRSVRSVQPNTGKIEVGGHSQDDTTSLMDNLDECMDELLQILRKKDTFQVVAIGFSCFVMNLVGVDDRGTIVGDAASISYACNAPEVAKQCKNLRIKLSEESINQMYHATGAPIHSAYALPQLLDIYDTNNPQYQSVRASVHKWQTIPSICLSRWAGATVSPISYSEASWTGLLNFRTCQYEPSVVDLLPESCRQSLPDLADFSDLTSYPSLGRGIQQQKSSTGNSNPYWGRWPELRGPTVETRGCRLFLGLGDGACANIGSKCSTASRIAVTIGTSAASRVCLPLPVTTGSSESKDSINVPKGLFCYRINRDHVLLGGALTDGGSVVEWISNLLNLNATSGAFEECMAQVKTLLEEDYNCYAQQSSTKQSLTVIPFLSGERSTGYRVGATGAILGLTRETTPSHLLKSSLEGVTLRLNAVLGLIRSTMTSSQEQPCVIASGKALEVNSLWRQLIADCSGMNVIMDGDTEEGTSRGVALAVAVALGEKSSFKDEPLHVLHESSPDPSAKDYWAHATQSQETFLDTISPLFVSSKD